ncbi:MAG: 50S ribosomal protein L9 [Alphaproteobacteria bacterium]
MDVILLERIERLGKMGDVVKVKSGFARNYLLPQKKALRATPDNLKYFESQRAQLEAVNLTHRADAETTAKRLDGQSVVLLRQAGESGQLYGSVTTRDIVEGLATAGFTVERRMVALHTPIKALGVYPVRVALHPEVSATVSVNVAKSDEEAIAQATAAAAPPSAEEEPEEGVKAKGKKRKKPDLLPGADTAFEAGHASGADAPAGDRA